MWSVEYDLGLEESLTRDELSVLHQFYERMLSCPLDICRSKRYLVRWLRARSWDVDEAEKMLYSHIKWRDVQKVMLMFNINKFLTFACGCLYYWFHFLLIFRLCDIT